MSLVARLQVLASCVGIIGIGYGYFQEKRKKFNNNQNHEEKDSGNQESSKSGLLTDLNSWNPMVMSLVPQQTPTAVVSAIPTPPPLLTPPKTDDEIMKYGLPGNINVLKYEGHVVSFDYRTRNPLWACEHLKPTDESERTADRANSTFKEDESIPPMFRAKLTDFVGSGYDRGHLVPAADVKTSQKAMDDTFFLTNVSPQVGEGFNRDYWARLESFVRRLSKQHDGVYVCTGPLFLPQKDQDGKWFIKYQVIGDPPSIAVPTHFFKVILGESSDDKYTLGAFIIPNSPIPADTPLETYAVPVESVERSSGLTFFDKLPSKRSSTPLCSAHKCILPPPQFWEKNKGVDAHKTRKDAETHFQEKLKEASSIELTVAPKKERESSSIPIQISTTDIFRRQLQIFKQNSKDTEIKFPPTLSAQEKKIISHLAEEEGLEHYESEKKFLIVRKPQATGNPNVIAEANQKSK